MARYIIKGKIHLNNGKCIKYKSNKIGAEQAEKRLNFIGNNSGFYFKDGENHLYVAKDQVCCYELKAIKCLF